MEGNIFDMIYYNNAYSRLITGATNAYELMFATPRIMNSDSGVGQFRRQKTKETKKTSTT